MMCKLSTEEISHRAARMRRRSVQQCEKRTFQMKKMRGTPSTAIAACIFVSAFMQCRPRADASASDPSTRPRRARACAAARRSAGGDMTVVARPHGL